MLWFVPAAANGGGGSKHNLPLPNAVVVWWAGVRL